MLFLDFTILQIFFLLVPMFFLQNDKKNQNLENQRIYTLYISDEIRFQFVGTISIFPNCSSIGFSERNKLKRGAVYCSYSFLFWFTVKLKAH